MFAVKFFLPIFAENKDMRVIEPFHFSPLYSEVQRFDDANVFVSA